MQIIDTQITIKTVQEVEKVRKKPYEKPQWIVKKFICTESSSQGDLKSGLRIPNGQGEVSVLFDQRTRLGEI